MQQQFEVIEVDLEAVRDSLLENFKPQRNQIEVQETEKIRDIINNIQFSNGSLYFANKATLQALKNSSHPVLKEWGEKCDKFLSANPIVYESSGIVSTPYIDRYGYQGAGFWSIYKNGWESTTSVSNYFYFNTYIAPYSSINPTTFELISPVHVAALTGDVNLMKYLVQKGMRLEENLNKWQITPLEMAVRNEQITMIDFLFENKVNNTNQALNFAVEKGCFSIIEQLINYQVPLTDEIIELARIRSQELGCYLEERRKADIQQKLTKEDPLKVLQSLLEYPQIPGQTITYLICCHPETINTIDQESDGNTLLHKLVVSGEVKKVKALMQAIYKADFKIKNLGFDIEKKNSQGKTVLDLALAQKDPEIISAILLYSALPPSISKEQESLLINQPVNLPTIKRERETRDYGILRQQFREIQVLNKVSKNMAEELQETQKTSKDTVEELRATKQELAQLKNVNTLLVEQMALQFEQLQIQQRKLDYVVQRLGFAPPIPNPIPGQPLLEYPTDNRNLLFYNVESELKIANQADDEPKQIGEIQLEQKLVGH